MLSISWRLRRGTSAVTASTKARRVSLETMVLNQTTGKGACHASGSPRLGDESGGKAATLALGVCAAEAQAGVAPGPAQARSDAAVDSCPQEGATTHAPDPGATLRAEPRGRQASLPAPDVARHAASPAPSLSPPKSRRRPGLLPRRLLARSVRFYVDQLGFEEDFQVEGWAFLSRGACQLRLGHCPDAVPMSKAQDHSWFAYLHVDDAQAMYREVLEKGVEIWLPLADRPWGQREFAIVTPDGHRLVVGQVLA